MIRSILLIVIDWSIRFRLYEIHRNSQILLAKPKLPIIDLVISLNRYHQMYSAVHKSLNMISTELEYL